MAAFQLGDFARVPQLLKVRLGLHNEELLRST
jgi:hypothetical protein